jgi:transketolase
MSVTATKKRRMDSSELQSKVWDTRKRLVRLMHHVQYGHPGGVLSVVDIVVTLYHGVLNLEPTNPKWEDRDRVIVSKGHGCPTQYMMLADLGFFPQDELYDTYAGYGSRFQGHPDVTTPGIDTPTGSLGQGLSVGVGMAAGGKLLGKDFRVYVILGDGETHEGQVWEAAMAAAKYKLDNLVAIVDYNRHTLAGATEEIMPIEPFADKWRAFNWHVLEVDGHSCAELLGAFQKAKEVEGMPVVVIAHTTKGKGVSFMENTHVWHGGFPNDEQLEQALTDLNKQGG